MRNTLNGAMAAAAVSLMIAFPVTANGQNGESAFPPARVEVAIAELREMAPSVDVSGTVVSLNDSRVASEIEGVLTWFERSGFRRGLRRLVAACLIEAIFLDVSTSSSTQQ